MTTSQTTMDTPVGTMLLTADGDALTEAKFVEPDVGSAVGDATSSPVLDEACRQFAAYFEGRLQEFDVPLAAGGTAFQQRVWAELRAIPYGTTSSYGAIAAQLGMRPGAARAVGMANGANPIAVIVPCHRVIGAKGKLIGYNAGLDRKRYLLRLESPDLLFAGETAPARTTPASDLPQAIRP
jgi:methylated-DNA-[protein]-cysteine S-methyltransferase